METGENTALRIVTDAESSKSWAKEQATVVLWGSLDMTQCGVAHDSPSSEQSSNPMLSQKIVNHITYTGCSMCI